MYELKEYIGVKKVLAHPITLFDFANDTGVYPSYTPSTDPRKMDGYLVAYPDKEDVQPNTELYPYYVSWMPASVFENSYFDNLDQINDKVSNFLTHKELTSAEALNLIREGRFVIDVHNESTDAIFISSVGSSSNSFLQVFNKDFNHFKISKEEFEKRAPFIEVTASSVIPVLEVLYNNDPEKPLLIEAVLGLMKYRRIAVNKRNKER